MASVLAIDPGERVGWATGEVDEGLEVADHGVAPLRDFAIKLGESVSKYDVVIYETWRLRADVARKMVGNDFQPSQLIGIIRYLGWITPGVKLVSQGPQIKRTALKTMPIQIHRRMHLSSEQHDQDALMHLWYYAWKQKTTKGTE